MSFKPLEHQDGGRRQVAVDFEGNIDEVLYLKAFGKDTGISIKLDDAKTGIVILTKNGMYRQAI